MYQFIPQSILRSATLSAFAVAIIFLSGCGVNAGTAAPGSITVSLATGSLHGGQQPVQGAHIYFYAANTTGYGKASISLLTSGASGTTTDSTGTYVTSDANGNFSYGGKYASCTAGTQVYLLALGGNPTGVTGGAQNPSIGLSAALGDCAGLTSSTFTNVNEVSTVAMAYALNGFMTNPTHVATSPANSAGLNAAFATVNNLVNSNTGTSLTTTPGGNGVPPRQAINMLANILAYCVNSTTGGNCSTLFGYATPTSGTPPTDTFSAMINIAAFPAAQVANLYPLASGFGPFQPTLSPQPNDFSLGITYTPAVSVIQPGAVVIDNAGNIWMANCQSCSNPTATDSIVEYASDGTFLHSYSDIGIHNTKGIAIGASGSVLYSVNQAVPGSTHTQDQLTGIITSTGALLSGFPVTFDPATYGTNTFAGVAVDNSGEIWTTATDTGAVVELTPSGNLINGSPFFVGGTLGVAVDNIGNIWFAGVGGNNIIEFDTNGNFLQNYTPAGLNQPLDMAINGSNELLTINNGSNTLSKIEFFNGNNASGSPYGGLGLAQAAITAIDGTSQVIIPNCRASCPGSGSTLHDNLLRLTQSGESDTGTAGTNSGIQIPAFSGIGGAAIDASGNVWVSNSVSGNLTEVIGFASPTIQPLAAASTNATIGQKP